ncbi:MAG: tripartite tricarboxylate transporter substrate binding protein [Burkholderiales bacterium]|nr:tripartite tricarboxylate transporter substrate binding protein [Burkholderiales bacterium]
MWKHKASVDADDVAVRMTNLVRGIQGIVFMIGFALGVSAASAQTPPYPSKPVRVIMPLAAGSGADVVTRMITPKLGEALGQQFIVDNRVGFSGNIGAEMAARSAPDGYTLLIAFAGNAISQTFFSKLGYNLEKDLDAVGLIGSLPLVLVVHPSLPVKSIKELITFAKARPRELYYASPGNGSLPHLTAELFKEQGGMDVVHVPYKSTTQAISELIGGQTAMTFAATLSALPHHRSGRLRVLAISTAKRSAVVPDLPTIAESGLKGFDVGQWYGMLAPSGTPRDIVARLNKDLTNIIRMPDINEGLVKRGVDPITSTPEEFAAYVRAEVVKWAKVVKASGARAD